MKIEQFHRTKYVNGILSEKQQFFGKKLDGTKRFFFWTNNIWLHFEYWVAIEDNDDDDDEEMV